MTGPAERLRSAAEHIDDARIDLDYGDLEIEAQRELEEIAAKIDDVCLDVQQELRNLAILVEANQAVEEADEHDS